MKTASLRSEKTEPDGSVPASGARARRGGYCAVAGRSQ